MASIWDSNVKSKCFTPTQLIELSYTNTGQRVQKTKYPSWCWQIAMKLLTFSPIWFSPFYRLSCFGMFIIKLLQALRWMRRQSHINNDKIENYMLIRAPRHLWSAFSGLVSCKLPASYLFFESHYWLIRPFVYIVHALQHLSNFHTFQTTGKRETSSGIRRTWRFGLRMYTHHS